MGKPVVIMALVVACATLACAQPVAVRDSTPGGEPKYGGRINIWMTSDPNGWDPSRTGSLIGSSDGVSLAYDSVLGMKYGPDVPFGDLILQPELAERWEISPDARMFTFQLRKGVKFADAPPVNGRAFTAQDVKWSYEYWSRTGQFKDKGLPTGHYVWMLEGLERVETPDPSTVVVHFKEPFAPFINYAATERIPVAPHEIYDQDGHLQDQMVGTAAFQFDMPASQKGSRWVWKKNPNYWESGRPYLDEVRWIVMPDSATGLAAFQTKQIDEIGTRYNIVGTEVRTTRQSNPQAVEYRYLSPSPFNIYLNVRRPPFDNPRVRKAVSFALDRDEFIKVFSEGEGAWALAGALIDTFSQDEVKQIVRYDPAEAKRLLAQAGYPDGLNLEFTASANYGQTYGSQAELLQAQLKKAGINMTIKMLSDHPDYLRLTRGNTFDLTFRNKRLEYDVDSYLYAVFHPGQATNYGGVNDPALTEMLVAQRREGDPEKRREIVRRAVRYVNENAWGLAMYYERVFNYWHPYVKNYAPHWAYFGTPLTHTWLDK